MIIIIGFSLAALGISGAVAIGAGLPNRVLLFESTRSRTFNTYLVDADRGILRQSQQQIACYHATWSPDGRDIACRARGRGQPGIYIIDPLAGRLALLADAAVESGLAWSPDGTRLAYVIVGGQDGIGVIDLVSGAQAQVRARGFSARPVWSPDGGQIAFGSTLDGLVLANADGTHRRALDVPINTIATPVWLPDAAGIIFQNGTPGTRQNLIHLDLATGVQTPLTTGDYSARPVPSPDGAQIAFVRLIDGRYWLATYDLATGTIRDLSARANTYTTASWSPDGGWLAFDSWGEGVSGVYVVRVDGTGEQRVTSSALDYGPRWRPS